MSTDSLRNTVVLVVGMILIVFMGCLAYIADHIDDRERVAIVTPIVISQAEPEPPKPEFKPLTHWSVDAMNMFRILSSEEGYSSVPYICSEGYVTIGLGTKLHKSKGMNPEDFPIKVTRKIAEDWMREEVAIKDIKLSNSIYGIHYKDLDDDRRAIIISMAYQMGVSGTLRFKKMWQAIMQGDWETAAVEALDSRWAQQTPERAERHARVLRGESLTSVYNGR